MMVLRDTHNPTSVFFFVLFDIFLSPRSHRIPSGEEFVGEDVCVFLCECVRTLYVACVGVCMCVCVKKRLTGMVEGGRDGEGEKKSIKGNTPLD